MPVIWVTAWRREFIYKQQGIVDFWEEKFEHDLAQEIFFLSFCLYAGVTAPKEEKKSEKKERKKKKHGMDNRKEPPYRSEKPE